jgi:PST family polysaccharide transporter
LQDDPQRYRLFVRTTLLGLFGLTLPATALLTTEADNVVLLLFGGQWLGAIPMLRILGVGAYCSTFVLAMSWLYLPEGRTREQLRWSLISAPVTILAVAIGLRWGAIGVARGFTLSSILLVAPGVWHCLRRSPLTAGDFWQATWRAAVASIGAAVFLWVLRERLPVVPNLLGRLVLHCAVYGVLYVTFALALPGGRTRWGAFWTQLRRAGAGLAMT